MRLLVETFMVLLVLITVLLCGVMGLADLTMLGVI